MISLELASFADLDRLDIRVGTISDVQEYPEAKNPSYKLQINLGEAIGIKKSIAQLTTHYQPSQLIGKQVICVVNFPPRQIGKAISEVLTLGVPDVNGHCVLLAPDRQVPPGGRLY